ncbi:PQQ-dependent sugar dehydrogenase [Geminicoccus roseus]|uniref:PQQ-dependent sugar dehydrogenase n=1 Tax=Geminicoccus roseus TaxID=404900 RepID=UPI0004014B91|nr:PQQ-dependent sugar dehydrogenase [Geminicoccus roseus]
MSRAKPEVDRREALRLAMAGLGGLAAGVLPGLEAQAAITDPIPARVQKSSLPALELVDFSAPPRTSDKRPFALLNFLYHAGDGTRRLFANDSRGKIWLIDRSSGAARLFLDLRRLRGSAFLFTSNQMGLRSFAFHPDFARAGRPGYRKFYTISTETVASRPSGVRLFSGPFTPLFHDVLAEWKVYATDRSRVDPGYRREILRIAQNKTDHNTDQIMFDPNAVPGTSQYGKLFIGIGDGGNNPQFTDPHYQAQNRGRALGKVFCIDPLRQPDGRAYRVPADNPFVGKSGYLPEIWALGLRHPQNLSFDPGGAGRLILTDIGQAHIEEVNLGIKGANYGWPLREGTFDTDRRDPTRLYPLPRDDAGKGFTYPVAQYDHDEGRAIAGGFVYRGRTVPALAGQYLFGDIVNGRVFHVPVSELRPGRQATIRELSFKQGGKAVTLRSLVNGVNGRVDLRFGQDEDGEIYILTKQDGRIRKLR